MQASLVVLLSFVAGAVAQTPTPLASAPQAPFTGLFVAAPADDGATWVRGERYKLGLLADGAHFQPLFGPAAPRDFPVRFQLAAVEVGGVARPLGDGAPWQRRDDRFTRDRGALRECWQVTAAAAQQYFEIDRPLGAGPMTLRIACFSDLALVDDGPGVRFVAEGLGDVRYSDAVVIDAVGRRLEVPVEVVGGQLAITVPTAFTAAAAWPLLVDPLVTTFAVDTTVSDMQDAKVSCDPTSGNWLVVAEEHLSATDVDVLCRRYDNAATPVLLDTTYAALTPEFTHNPDVGSVSTSQQFIVAWHNTAGNGNFQWRARSATTTTMNGPFSTSAGIGGNLDNRPMIGSSLANDRFLLVMFRKNTTGTDILASLLRTTGTNFGTLFVGPVVSPAQGTVAPGGVSTLASVTDRWVVVWRECTSAACSQQTIRMQAIATTAGFGPLVPEPAVNLVTGSLEDEPAIAGQAGKLLAVWRTFDGATNSNDIHGVPVGVVGGVYAPLGAVQNLSAQEPNVNNVLEQLRPAVSYDGVRFLYGYLEDDGNDILRACAATVFVNGASILWHEGHLVLSAAPTLNCRSLDLGFGATANPGVHWAVWQQDSAAFTGDVQVAVVDARKAGPTFTIDQTGCGLPVEPGITLAGTPALGRTFTVSLTNVPVFPVLLVGPQNGSALPGCGSCSLGVDLSAMQLFAGSSLAVTVPVDPALIQFRLAFQGLSGLQSGGCPAAFIGFPFALSDTLTIQVM